MATRSSIADQGAFAQAFMRNAAIFLIGHFLFRGNEALWVVLAAATGVVVGAAGMWLFRYAHNGSLLDAVTRPGPRRARP